MSAVVRWYVAWDRQLIEMANEGASGSAIAEALAIRWARPFSRAAVLARARRLNVCLARRATGVGRGAGRPKTDEPAARVDAVRSRIEAGTTLRATADELGLSLSTVRRIVSGHGIKAPGRSPRTGPKVPRGFGNLIFGPKASLVPAAPSVIPDRTLMRNTAVPFIDRRPGQCAFPLWGKAERIGNVCGGEALPGESWCPGCRRIVFGRVSSVGVAA